jgi:hypothetical protein
MSLRTIFMLIHVFNFNCYLIYALCMSSMIYDEMYGDFFFMNILCLEKSDVPIFQTRCSEFTGKTGCFDLPN